MIFLKIILFSKKLLLCYVYILVFLILVATFLYHITFHNTSLCHNPIFASFSEQIQYLTKGTEKIAYLTFDDGPTVSVTPKVLDILASEQIKATFFVIGKSVEEHPEIVKRAHEEGHYIANHSYSHNNAKLYKSKENFLHEIQLTDDAIAKALEIDSYHSYVFRFPNGFMAPLYQKEKKEVVSLLSDIHYTYLDWNALTQDSVKKCSTSQLLTNLKQSCQNKGTLVVLMHDTKDVNDSSLVLKDCITYLKEQGYEFRNLYSLLPSF